MMAPLPCSGKPENALLVGITTCLHARSQHKRDLTHALGNELSDRSSLEIRVAAAAQYQRVSKELQSVSKLET